MLWKWAACSQREAGGSCGAAAGAGTAHRGDQGHTCWGSRGTRGTGWWAWAGVGEARGHAEASGRSGDVERLSRSCNVGGGAGRQREAGAWSSCRRTDGAEGTLKGTDTEGHPPGRGMTLRLGSGGEWEDRCVGKEPPRSGRRCSRIQT